MFTMMTNEYVLELCNVFYNGQVEPGNCYQKVLGDVRMGAILKDVSLEIRSGEVMAILGSKGSGKRALLEVISRRAQGSVRGQILFNNVPVSLRLFQDSCGYVPSKCHYLPGLSVMQTLHYVSLFTIGSKVSGVVKRSRVKQVLADLALTQVANWSVGDLSTSEYRRLSIATQMVKDPVVLLLDEPTWDLDPLNTYFVVSILANHAKKYNRIVILTMEKPRSDIFPFLDRVTYLCLGDVVYTGSTRMMLDYFRNIGFPCPELENPLMYYLCLSTVDRRSRERFVESTNQISALVEKFKLEGAPFRKYTGPSLDMDHGTGTGELQSKVPLTAFGKPACGGIFAALLVRFFASTFNIRRSGMKQIFLRWGLIPLYFFILWIFYYGQNQNSQRVFVTRNGLLLNSLLGVSLLAIGITSWSFGPHRTRYYQETREGIYMGPLFIFCYDIHSMCLSFLTVLAGSKIISGLLDLNDKEWFLFACVLYSVYIFMEQQTIAIMMVVKSSYRAAICSVYFAIIYTILGSGCLRSLSGLPDWLAYLTYVIQPRYSGAVLHELVFRDQLYNLPVHKTVVPLSGFNNYSPTVAFPCSPQNSTIGCRYFNGTMYLAERYHFGGSSNADSQLDLFLRFNFNLGISFAFSIGMTILNLLLYVIPLPAFIKAKFRE